MTATHEPVAGSSALGEPSAYEPIAVEGRHAPPAVSIDPDTSLGWFRRLLPIVKQHRRPLVVGAVTGVIALVLQVAVPAAARSAIDATRAADESDLNTWIVVLLILAVGRFAFGAAYRYALFQLAFSELENPDPFFLRDRQVILETAGEFEVWDFLDAHPEDEQGRVVVTTDPTDLDTPFEMKGSWASAAALNMDDQVFLSTPSGLDLVTGQRLQARVEDHKGERRCVPDAIDNQ